MRDTLTYPEHPEGIETDCAAVDAILVVIEFLSEFLDFYLL